MKVLLLVFLGSLSLAANGYNLNVNVFYDGSLNSTDYLKLECRFQSSNQSIPLSPSVTTPNLWTASLLFSTEQVDTIVEIQARINDTIWALGAPLQVKLPNAPGQVNYYPWFFSTQGGYKTIGPIYSPQLKNIRNLHIYTPPSYYENTLKPMTNILVMHDGQDLFSGTQPFSVSWHCDTTVDQLVVAGEMEEILIIGVDSTDDYINEYTYVYDPCYKRSVTNKCVGGGGKGDLYLDFISDTVIPFVVSSGYRMENGQSNMAILGSSYGGLISCYAGWTRNDTYSKSGCMSSEFVWAQLDFNNNILNNIPPPMNENFYLDATNCCPVPFSGSRFSTAEVYGHMLLLGFEVDTDIYYYFESTVEPGTPSIWGARFHVPMEYFYPPTVTVPSQ